MIDHGVCKRGHSRDEYWNAQDDYCEACFPARAKLSGELSPEEVMQQARRELATLKELRANRQRLLLRQLRLEEELHAWVPGA